MPRRSPVVAPKTQTVFSTCTCACSHWITILESDKMFLFSLFSTCTNLSCGYAQSPVPIPRGRPATTEVTQMVCVCDIV